MRGGVYNDQTRVGEQLVTTPVDSRVQFIFLLLKEFTVLHRKVVKTYTGHAQSRLSETTTVNIFRTCVLEFSSGQMGWGDQVLAFLPMT